MCQWCCWFESYLKIVLSVSAFMNPASGRMVSAVRALVHIQLSSISTHFKSDVTTATRPDPDEYRVFSLSVCLVLHFHRLFRPYELLYNTVLLLSLCSLKALCQHFLIAFYSHGHVAFFCLALCCPFGFRLLMDLDLKWSKSFVLENILTLNHTK